MDNIGTQFVVFYLLQALVYAGCYFKFHPVPQLVFEHLLYNTQQGCKLLPTTLFRYPQIN